MVERFLVLLSFVLRCFFLRFQLITTNDLHSRFAGATSVSESMGSGTGNYARIFRVLTALRSKAPNSTLIVDAGDFFGGSMFHLLGGSSHFRFSPEFRFFEDAGFDATTIGNHEMDGRVELLLEMMSKSNGVDLPIVVSNFFFEYEGIDEFYKREEMFRSPKSMRMMKSRLHEKSDKKVIPYFTPHALRKITEGEKELRVCIIGLHGPGAYKLVCPANRQNTSIAGFDKKKMSLEYKSYFRYVKDFATRLRKEYSCDIILAISHSGSPYDRRLMKYLENKKRERVIDIHVSGHTHDDYLHVSTHDQSIVTQNKMYGERIGYLKLEYNFTTKSLKLLNPSTAKITVGGNIKMDEWMARKIAKYRELIHDVYFKNSEYPIYPRYQIPKEVKLKSKTKTDFVQWMVNCIHEELNRSLQDDQFDVYFLPWEYARVGNDIRYLLNSTNLYFEDLFTMFSISSYDGPIPIGSFINEYVAVMYLTKNELINLFELIDVYSIFDENARMIISEKFSFTKQRFGVPFVHSWFPRIARFRDVKIDGTPIDEVSRRYFKVGVKASFTKYLDLAAKMSFGLINYFPRDRFGNRLKEYIHSNCYEIFLFGECLKV